MTINISNIHRLLVVIALIMALYVTSLASAQSGLVVGIAGALPMQLDNSTISSPKLGYGGALSIGYQYKKGLFTLETDAQFSIYHNRMGIADQQYEFSMLDTRGNPFTYKGTEHDRTDAATLLNIEIPLMFGIETTYLYAQAGPKFSYTLNGTTKQTASLTTIGEDPRFYETLEDMENHGFSTEQYTAKDKISFKPDVRIVAEVGGIFGNNDLSKLRVRLGVFAEYGLLNTYQTPTDTPLTTIDATQYMTITNMQHFYNSHESLTAADGAEIKVHNLAFGVRLSFIFSSGKKHTSHSSKYKCRCED